MRAAAEVVTVEQALAKIPSGANVAVAGFVGTTHPEFLTLSLGEYFTRTQSPRDLTLIYAAGQGDGKERGLNHLALPGLVRRVIGGHWNLAPKLGKMALANQIEAYNFPQGVICELYREIAAKRPGLFTKVGINTFIDPQATGGKLNEITTEDLVERITLHGEEWLWYHAFPIHVSLIRATTADRMGNLSMEREAIVGEVLPLAQAAKNHGGIVIAQVEQVVDCISDPKSIRVPGILVDYIVVADKAHHEQTFAESFNPTYVERRDEVLTPAPIPFSERKIIGRRALQEIRAGDIVNLGIGLPEAVTAAASEYERLKDFTFSVESGISGGLLASGLSFGCSSFPEAVIDQPSQFDFYDGGGLDISVLGALEIDRQGNVCVSCCGDRFVGVGGFINISQNAKRLVFCCTFRAGGLEIEVENDALKIVQEGRHCKFVDSVEQVCFHGPTALENGHEVLYVTERAVFQLTKDGLELIEVADGISVQDQILDLMEFAPVIKNPQPMPRSCFDAA